MVRRLIGFIITAWLIAGCTSTSTTNLMFSDAQQCSRGGGWWRANLAVCEVQSEGKR
jgi:hypothetical protein